MARKLSDKNIRMVYDAIASGWYHVRQRSITDLSEVMAWKPGKLLDIGCGTAAYLKDLQNLGFRCIGVDLSGKTLSWATQWKKRLGLNYPLVQGDALALPFKSRGFDYAMCVAVIHHLDSAKKRIKALKEMRRVLKKGGRGMITVWNKNQPRFKNKKKDAIIPWTHEGKKYYRYYHLFDKKELGTLIRKSGLELLEIKEEVWGGVAKNIQAVVGK